MSQLVLFNKPFRVMSQFSPAADKATLKDFLPIPNIYPAGRLDYESEGLLLLTDNGKWQARLSDPRYGKRKLYWAEVENIPSHAALQQFRHGLELKDGKTRPAEVRLIEPPADLWPRDPPVRFRQNIPTQWLEIGLYEGRNRQVRRMTAAIGHPTLRLIRMAIDDWQLGQLAPGEYRLLKPETV